MPGVNGMEFCSEVKKTHNIPFIMNTGRGSEVVAEAAFQSGVNDNVSKESGPSHHQLIAKRIRSHAEIHRSERYEIRYQLRLERVQEDV
ncbi:MAG: response regulator [bacterium]